MSVHDPVIGRYEKVKVKPSIEMATQLEVSLDYLVGSTDTLLERSIVNRVFDQKTKRERKQHVFALLDAFLKRTKLQSIV
mgnify:CR=1 FL=1